jgi:hypothetical protein
MQVASNSQEYIRLGEAAPAHSFIYNSESRAQARRENRGVLAELSADALNEFEESMRFKEGCLLSAHCEKIERELDKQVAPFFRTVRNRPSSAWLSLAE